MLRVVIDTNVYFDWINRGQHEGVLFWRETVKYLSAVVLMELRAGALSQRDRRLLRRLQAAFERAGRILAPSGACSPSPVTRCGGCRQAAGTRSAAAIRSPTTS
jgi:hypothetical protein